MQNSARRHIIAFSVYAHKRILINFPQREYQKTEAILLCLSLCINTRDTKYSDTPPWGNDAPQDKEITGSIEPKEITLTFLSCVQVSVLWQLFSTHRYTVIAFSGTTGRGIHVTAMNIIHSRERTKISCFSNRLKHLLVLITRKSLINALIIVVFLTHCITVVAFRNLYSFVFVFIRRFSSNQCCVKLDYRYNCLSKKQNSI